ncbi:flavodoxin [Clostridium acetobutylicum]|uniref:Predicted flavodoxin n=1 Tax=Clostridium acetobutylicum (strain ATCC 824 / DSM 792 / JCM 1419 / IAM 19013 / LMG 5710 / NBRC 13948 / NRRL B-527 / VKM B-1787 / 2291 / W) TaxID=272562 RepID=Q97D18_CLOAB|nr:MULTISPECIES: flavodoxin [Clostridium]AAK81586.1 Predicted flavodoxin [Clostridium acetobutylicum ATCC 824]ADZ22708.1 flavodoxin [Clostridium acetobutylicum EA 2018]AEI32979.1 flavodoxin [Clostridium acetobutylicum DSM 1731]AWV80740.1 flavodoxin [Clostridium acetobutylicum]KHD35465.1 flavodoxin [Clostridium acetobutylicum]
MSNILVVFYSFSNTTKKLAGEIAEQTGGDIRELVPEKAYSFNYNTATKEVRNEVERGYCPKLLSGNESVEPYEYIFLGTPNWFKSFAPPILSFLRNADLQGKTIIPFCTHGGGGIGQIKINIEKECPKSTVLSGFAAMSDFDKQQVTNWLQGIGLF